MITINVRLDVFRRRHRTKYIATMTTKEDIDRVRWIIRPKYNIDVWSAVEINSPAKLKSLMTYEHDICFYIDRYCFGCRKEITVEQWPFTEISEDGNVFHEECS